jgi:hypothetical protein
MWGWSIVDHTEYQGRIKVEWEVDTHEYLVSSLDPSLPVSRFLEKEGLPTARERMARNVALLEKAVER